MKIGLLGARCDNGGLGIQTHEFYKHVKPDKTLVVKTSNYEQFPERYPDAQFVIDAPTNEDLEQFLEGLDVIFTVETPYNWNAYDIARRKGVVSFLQSNYEWLPNPVEKNPDVFVPGTLWYFNNLPSPKHYLPVPVDREKISFRLKTKAHTFVHVAGHIEPTYGRNGTQELLEAIPLVRSNVKFIIYSQVPLPQITDKRVRVINQDFPNYYDLYKEGDVLLYPRKYAGLSLSLNEALSAGFPVIMTDMKPQNLFLPEELLFKPDGHREITIRRPIECAIIKPETIARKIDEIANTNVAQYSRYSDMLANSISWDTLLPLYLQIFKSYI